MLDGDTDEGAIGVSPLLDEEALPLSGLIAPPAAPCSAARGKALNGEASEISGKLCRRHAAPCHPIAQTAMVDCFRWIPCHADFGRGAEKPHVEPLPTIESNEEPALLLAVDHASGSPRMTVLFVLDDPFDEPVVPSVLNDVVDEHVANGAIEARCGRLLRSRQGVRGLTVSLAHPVGHEYAGERHQHGEDKPG